MMTKLKKLLQPFGSIMALAIVVALAAAAMPGAAEAAGGSYTWTAQAEWEGPPGDPTFRSGIDTTSEPGSVKIDMEARPTYPPCPTSKVTNGPKLYTTGVGRNTIAVLDKNTNALLRTINLPADPPAEPNSMAYSGFSGKLYVSVYGGNKIYVIDTNTDTVDSTTLTAGSGAYVLAAGNSTINNINYRNIYIGNIDDFTISIYNEDPATPETPRMTTKAIPVSPYNAVYLGGYGKLMVTNKLNTAVAVIDATQDHKITVTNINPENIKIGTIGVGGTGLKTSVPGGYFPAKISISCNNRSGTVYDPSQVMVQVRTADGYGSWVPCSSSFVEVGRVFSSDPNVEVALKLTSAGRHHR